ncbi:small GTP-binding protein [Histomonas meleagridis]|uniref:small GTP-binding protein n=1 Tax=Histomonas meleagridis TaxID=135588 RepID=UPI0035593960|nr:small GTP-binding protein [Histomonas meleagridis]KAH0806406.1 small GTP-binding protein [Histomonas meleagridis]
MEDNGGIRPLKLILVGSAGVGKTSLMNALFEQSFEQDMQTTVAPAFCEKSIQISDGSKVTLHIWDTAGQEKFQSICETYYRDADVAFVCFDYENMNHETIAKWVSRVRAQSPDCLIFLVLTKEDLTPSDQYPNILEDSEGYVNEFKAEAFHMTSSSTQNGVKALFCSAAECVHKICEKQIPTSVVIKETKTTEKKPCKC